jgi:hypothetical protein
MKKLSEFLWWFEPEIGRGWPELRTHQNRKSPIFKSEKRVFVRLVVA